MSDDIAEFLRRAAQRRAQQRPPQIEILDADVVDAEILDAGETSREGVADHVAQHLDTSGFAERVSHLGETVDGADDRMEAHLHDVFEHKLGQLGTRTSAAEESVLDDDQPSEESGQKPPADVAEMLRSPQDLRRAIILSEILRRPEW